MYACKGEMKFGLFAVKSLQMSVASYLSPTSNSQLRDCKRIWCSRYLAETPQQTAQERPTITSQWVIIHFSGRVLKAVDASAAGWAVECYKEMLIPSCLYFTWQVTTRGEGGCGVGLSNGASLWATNKRWWGLIDLSGLMGTQRLTELQAASFNAKPNGQAWSNPLPVNRFTQRSSRDYPPTWHPPPLPLETGSNTLWWSMPYTPFSSLLKSVSQKAFLHSKPDYLSWHNLDKHLTLWVCLCEQKCTVHCWLK